MLFLKSLSLSIFAVSCLKFLKNVSTILGCGCAENAENATNQISASPPPPSQNDSVYSPSYSSPAKRRYLNFISPVKSPFPSPSKSYKSLVVNHIS